MSDLLEQVAKAVEAGNWTQSKELVERALREGMDPIKIVNEGLILGMNRVGERFRAGEMFVPEVLMSARAMHAGMDVLKPLLAGQELPTKGKVLIGTVEGDLHDIGKNLVAMMLEGAGFKVIDLGIDVKVKKFVEAVKEHNPDVVGMSALLTTTMEAGMRNTIKALEEAGLKDKVKIIVGGAPVSQDFADQIGADGYAPDAATAVKVVERLLQ